MTRSHRRISRVGVATGTSAYVLCSLAAFKKGPNRGARLGTMSERHSRWSKPAGTAVCRVGDDANAVKNIFQWPGATGKTDRTSRRPPMASEKRPHRSLNKPFGCSPQRLSGIRLPWRCAVYSGSFSGTQRSIFRSTQKVLKAGQSEAFGFSRNKPRVIYLLHRTRKISRI